MSNSSLCSDETIIPEKWILDMTKQGFCFILALMLNRSLSKPAISVLSVLFFIVFSAASAQGQGAGFDPNCVDGPPGAPPNLFSVVSQVASEHPDWLANSCPPPQGSGNTNFIDEVVSRLRARSDGVKWGYNGKRGNVQDLSPDAITYYYGPGESPDRNSMNIYEVYVIDIISAVCPEPTTQAAAWIDQTQKTLNQGTFGAYVFPRGSGESPPSPVLCSNVVINPEPGNGSDNGSGDDSNAPSGDENLPPPNGPPKITGTSQANKVAPGQTFYLYGTELGGTVTLQPTGEIGTQLTLKGTAEPGRQTLRVLIPKNVPPGAVYKISVNNGKGSFTFSEPLQIVASNVAPAANPLPPNPETILSLGELIQYIFLYGLYIVGMAVFVMIFWAGFIWFTAAGNASKISDAKSKIYNAIIGAILLLSAFLILYTINPDLVTGGFSVPGVPRTEIR